MIVASLCTIPVRKKSFQQVVLSILNEQTTPIDQLHVWLNGYSQVDSDLPQDARLIYHLEPTNPGPWVRYKVADELDDNSVLITLDDDMIYPGNYVHEGLRWVEHFEHKAAVCFTGITWDPFQCRFYYGTQRFHYMLDKPLAEVRRVAVNGGGASIFPSMTVQKIANLILPGFRTNDDMMVSYALQKKQIPIYCCPKPAGWLREAETSRAVHALFRTDISTRHKTFSEMVQRLGFDPTAGISNEFKRHKNRVLIMDDICPPLPGSAALDQTARQYCNADSSVHVLAGSPASLEYRVQQHVDIPYMIHSTSRPDPGGRLDNIGFVRSWRQWRIRHQEKKNWQERYQTIKLMLEPTQIHWAGQTSPFMEKI